MIAFISWYIVLALLGWLTFPLAYHLFPALADRGYTLMRALGLLVWGYAFWLFASLGIAQNDAGGLLLGLLVLVGLSGWAYWADRGRWNADDGSSTMVNRPLSMGEWVRGNYKLILTTEILFLVAFAFMAFIRASNPEVTTAGGEKWMEVAFINAIMHSPTFPPHDPWLSGYAISYYFFGYVMAAMLAELTAVSAPVAHNLMLSLIFALSAIGAYGLLYNLLSAYRRWKGQEQQTGLLPVLGGFLAPLFLLIASNLEGFFESLHRKGIGWTLNPDGTGTSPFWSWLNLQALTDPPAQPLKWVPDQYYWWWRASRVLQDYDLTGNRLEVIDEFPFFSYLLGDLHPHVLAMPFNLLAIAIALNIFLGGWRGQIDLFFGKLQINKTGFFSIALVLGGLAFLNTWDILPGAALIVFSYALARVRESGWGWERIEDVLLLGIPVIVTAFLMYLPFFIGFDSQAGGIIPNFMFVTRGAYLWVMWGTLFIPLLVYLFYLWRTHAPARWRTSLFTVLGFLLFLIGAMFFVGFIGLKLKPDLVNGILQSQGLDLGTFIADSMSRRLTSIGSLLTLLLLLIPALAFLLRSNEPAEDGSASIQPSTFVLLLITLGTLLILGPDFFYLRDNFGYRINTVFKFYYQAWILFSIAAAFTVAILLSQLKGLASILYTGLIVIVIAMGLFYSVFSLPSKTDNFKANAPEQRTLDGSTYLAGFLPEDYQAFKFMKTIEPGVVVEAVGPQGGQYSEYARVSTFTGLPAVLGWTGHEGQWRDYALQGTRKDDIQTLYSTPDWNTAQEIINRYNIRYVYVGPLERSTYTVNEEKFKQFLTPIYQQGNVTIYEVPSSLVD
jgi:YYY domain-containing protein